MASRKGRSAPPVTRSAAEGLKIPKADAPTPVGIAGVVDAPPPTPGGVATPDAPHTPTPDAPQDAPAASDPPDTPPPADPGAEAPPDADPLAGLSGDTPEIQNEGTTPPVAAGRPLKRYRVTTPVRVFWKSQQINLHLDKEFTEATFTRQALKAFVSAGLEFEEIT